MLSWQKRSSQLVVGVLGSNDINFRAGARGKIHASCMVYNLIPSNSGCLSYCRPNIFSITTNKPVTKEPAVSMTFSMPCTVGHYIGSLHFIPLHVLTRLMFSLLRADMFMTLLAAQHTWMISRGRKFYLQISVFLDRLGRLA